ncbi:OmpA family protein [Bdellovibrionota bacterium FG-2]
MKTRNLLMLVECGVLIGAMSACVMIRPMEEGAAPAPVAKVETPAPPAPVVQTAEQNAKSAEMAAMEAEMKKIQDLLAALGGKIHFDFNSADLTASSQDAVKSIAELLAKNPSEKLRLDGFTDGVGTAKYNEELSMRRTEAVNALLKQHGVKDEQIVAFGHGMSMPIASNETTEGRFQNRRVELKLEPMPTG